MSLIEVTQVGNSTPIPLDPSTTYAVEVDVTGMFDGLQATIVDQNGNQVPFVDLNGNPAPVFDAARNDYLASPNVVGATTTSLTIATTGLTAGIASFNITLTPV